METPDKFEARITAALEQRRDVAVPADFAARIASALPQGKVRRRRLHAGRAVSVAICVLMLVAMVALAPRASESLTNHASLAELCLTAALGAMACWLGLKWRQV